MIDPVSALTQAVSLVKRLRETSKKMAEAEFNNLLADLMNELADAKIQAAAMKSQLATQADEIRQLKAAEPSAKVRPKVKWGCYLFEGDDNLYCTACYDSRGEKSLTTRLDSEYRKCPVCDALLGAG